MGSFANTLFTTLMGWTQSVISALWSLFTSTKGNGVLRWVGDHWVVLAIVLCAVGLIADLGVYLARWRPYLVWKSFLKRRRGEDGAENPEEGTELPGETAAVPVREGVPPVRTAPLPPPAAPAQEEAEDELARWKREPDLPKTEIKSAAPPLVTAAGYVVPDDSPYRRPAAKQNRPEPAAADGDADRDSALMQSAKRKKRINVNDLFASPEEEIYEFDAPQNLIDRNKAYRQPVYPRGWNRGKEKEE